MNRSVLAIGPTDRYPDSHERTNELTKKRGDLAGDIPVVDARKETR